MSDNDYDGYGDDLSRLIRRLRADSKPLSETILGGGCEREEYIRLCARLTQINEILQLASDIRAGKDRPRREEGGRVSVNVEE
jgi:hypothetical protein